MDLAPHQRLMREALRAACESPVQGGGPFGALVARAGAIVAVGMNRVVSQRDPTAHAEIEAIRAASLVLGTHDLTGCEIYSSAEPCPMCLGAIYWSRLDRIWFAASRDDAASAGFDDRRFYDELVKPLACRAIPTTRLAGLDEGEPFRIWNEMAHKTRY